jgi:class 3 adenylate cyclase/tetratricopeptide (TPR) repeat protein
MDCFKCKFQNPEGIKFCGECGNKLEQICPECDSLNPPRFKFCGECGFRLQKQHQKSTQINYSEPQSYTPKHLADKILVNRSSIEGERKLVTVLFADVTNYTSISENLDPEEMHQIMDGCFKILMNEIHKYEGSINQFTGDGVMALFGAPMAHEDHAQRACRAALNIQETIKKYSDDLKSKFDILFEMRIGINSGLVVVGSIGDDLRMDYTAVGDTTNLAARMENVAKAGAICISENTQKLVRDFFELEFQGEIQIKGKEKLQKTYQLIKKGEIVTRIDASIAKGLTRFVGRRESMATLTQSFEKVKSGSGQILGIVGEPGVGKSRLLFEMRKKMPPHDHRYVEGRCLQYGGSIIYLPILDILRSIFNIKNDDKEFLVKRKINDVVSHLGNRFIALCSPIQDVLSVTVDDESFMTLEPKEKREKIFESIRNLLIRISQDKPLIIAVEDLHWIDKTSEDFLNYFIDWLANTQILLILLYRPEYNHPWGSKSFYTKIGINQLGLNSSEDLIKSILEESDVAPELNQLILSRSAGNPLFMEEFTHALLENGTIERKEHIYALKRNPEEIRIPDTVQGIISARLDRLEDNLKKILQVASVIGRDFAFKILQSITGIRADLKSYLLNLQGMEFIYEKNLFPELEYIFKHALTQEVAYNSLLQKRRKEIHEQIGMAIETLYPERLDEFLEVLAYHYCRSDNIEKAVQYCKLAGQKAEKNFAHWDAFSFFKNAYDAISQYSENQEILKEKIAIIELMVRPLVPLGLPPDEGLWAYDNKIKLSEKLGDSKLIAESYINKANYYTHRGNSELAIKNTRSAFEEARKQLNLELMVKSAWVLSFSYSSSGEYAEITSIVPEVVNLIEIKERKTDFFGPSNPIPPYCLLNFYCGLGMGLLGHFNNGIKYFENAIDSAYAINDAMTIGSVELTWGLFYITKGDWPSALTHLKSGLKHITKTSWPWLEALCWCCMGYVYTMIGDLEKGKNKAAKGLDLHLASGAEVYLTLSYYFSGLVCLETGNLKQSLIYIKNALKRSKTNSEKELESRSLLTLGEIFGKLYPENRDKAFEKIDAAMVLLTKLQFKPYLAQGHLISGDIYRKAREQEKAVQSLKEADRLFQEMEMDFWMNKTRNVLSELS